MKTGKRLERLPDGLPDEMTERAAGAFCQNHEISMSGGGDPETVKRSASLTAERVCRLADAAEEYRSFVYTGNCQGQGNAKRLCR